MNKLFILIATLALSGSLQATELRLATWNIYWLGDQKNNRTEADYNELRQYAKELDADVIALQEVASAEWARKIFGDDYRYYFSSRNHVQKVGFAVKKSEGFSVENAVDYTPLGLDGSVRYGKDLTLKVGDQSIRLLGVHLKSLCFDKPLDAATIRRQLTWPVRDN